MIEIVSPNKPIQGQINPGASKSISNRLLILQHLFHPTLQITNCSVSEDTLLLSKALKQIKEKSSNQVDIHHAGTDMRFLTALLSVTEGEWIIGGSERLNERPIAELVKALRELGADINYVEKENYPPLLIKGKKLKGGSVAIEANISSQFISALILIGASLEKGLTLKLKGAVVSRSYINMSITLMKLFGIEVRESIDTIQISPLSSTAKQNNIVVESDWSSASYYYSLCSLSENSTIKLSNFQQKSIQADAVLPVLFEKLGVQSTFESDMLILKSIPKTSKQFSYNCNDCPDLAPTLALTCFGLGIPCYLSGLSTLKVKETDRLTALKTELEKLGASVNTGDDFIHIASSSIKHYMREEIPQIMTYKDHRMAMSFVPLVLKYGKLQVEDPSVVDKSYPGFWEDLKSLGFNVNLLP